MAEDPKPYRYDCRFAQPNTAENYWATQIVQKARVVCQDGTEGEWSDYYPTLTEAQDEAKELFENEHGDVLDTPMQKMLRESRKNSLAAGVDYSTSELTEKDRMVTPEEMAYAEMGVDWATGPDQHSAIVWEVNDGEERLVKQQYESDIVVGERYEDTRTGLQGVAVALAFFEFACERVTLEYRLSDGNLAEATFDAPRLKHVETRQQAEAEKPGGPDRGRMSRGPIR